MSVTFQQPVPRLWTNVYTNLNSHDITTPAGSRAKERNLCLNAMSSVVLDPCSTESLDYSDAFQLFQGTCYKYYRDGKQEWL
jgi:hypothetical protein